MSIRNFIVILFLSANCTSKFETPSNDKRTNDVHNESIDTIPKLKSKQIPYDSFLLENLFVFNSEKELQVKFKGQCRSEITLRPETFDEYPITVILRDTPKQVTFEWKDEVNRESIYRIIIAGQKSVWKTAEGITLGTSLHQLEEINQAPFKFHGFDWYHPGETNWADSKFSQRNLIVVLGFPEGPTPSSYDSLMTTDLISSDSSLAQRAKLVVASVMMEK
jgi:hypothetical protein